jgi:hypothetical protein
MKTLNIILTALAVAAAALVPAAAVSGQYYTPLRYDLRYTSPTYIPSGTMRFGPSGPNPYAFGSPLYSDLSVTGNLRAGKSFHGNVPYSQSGSQISTNLGTNRLSNFTRDSIGVGDIGTGVEYGAPMPYYAPSGSVTNIGTAQQRFVTPMPGSRAPYTVQNPNAIPARPRTTAATSAARGLTCPLGSGRSGRSRASSLRSARSLVTRPKA